jgi:hypothetical protein
VASRVWLGDLAVAWRALAPGNERALTMVADLLGLTPAVEAPDGIREPDNFETIDAAGAIETYPGPAMPPVRGRDQPSATAGDLPLLRPVSHEPAPPMTWTVASLSRAPASPRPPAPSHEPLFPRRTAAAIIQALLGQDIADGPLDADAAVNHLAALQPLRSLPRLRRRTLRFGAQILVDQSDTMRLFARDQAGLVWLTRRLLGERAEVWYYVSCPLHGVTKPPYRHLQPYRPPTTNRSVLLLSDFGAITHPNAPPGASRWEWEQFFGLIRHYGCTPIGLIPYPRNRCPEWLTAQLPLITWDRGTTAGTIRARLR